MTDPVETPVEETPVNVEAPANPAPVEKDGIVAKFGKGLLWVFDIYAGWVQSYPRTSAGIMLALVASRMFF